MEKIKTRYWDMAAVTYESLLAEMESWMQTKEKTRLVCFCDANGLAHGWRDEELTAAYRKSDAVVADGIIMMKLAAIYGGELPGRVIGPVFFEKAMEYGLSRGWRHFFCGTNEETLKKLKSNLELKFPGVNIVGTYAPEYALDPKPPVVEPSGVDFFWVALGSPKQEKWCARHLSEFKAACVLPVGAAFDFHAGMQKPVPTWVHRLGVCWLWRMCTGGKRVLKRDLWCVPRAAMILVCEFVRTRIFRRK